MHDRAGSRAGPGAGRQADRSRAAGARARHAGRDHAAHPQRPPHGGRDAVGRDRPQARLGRSRTRHDPVQVFGLGGTKLRRVSGPRRDARAGGRFQRLRRQGALGREDYRVSAPAFDVQARAEHPGRQRGPVRGDLGRGVLQRTRGRALRRAQLRGHRGGRGPGRSRLRVHDPGAGHLPGRYRKEFRRGHVGRDCLRAGRNRRVRQDALQSYRSRSGNGRHPGGRRNRCVTGSRATPRRPAARAPTGSSTTSSSFCPSS